MRHDDRNGLFGCFEAARKTAGDLVLLTTPEEKFTLTKFHVGYERQLAPFASMRSGVGAALTLNFTPSPLANTYGDSLSAGFFVFVSLRPQRMETGHSMTSASVGGVRSAR